jgi:GR25 family glycosyltransferase involved in LPS biosynthesis
MSVYNAFDRVICINLSSRQDKKQSVSKVFKSLNIPVQFYTAQPQPLKGGRYGCFHSHISVIKKAYDDGLDNILIFEDDVVPSPTYNEASVRKAISFLETNKDHVDILQLGYFPVITETGTMTPFINAPFVDDERTFMKITTAGFHAYCLTKRGMHNIVNSNWKTKIDDAHIDIFVASLGLNGYCFTPTLFEQYSCLGSDNIARSFVESVGRKFQCSADKIYLMHKLSLIKKYSLVLINIVIISIITVLLFIIITIYHRS